MNMWRVKTKSAPIIKRALRAHTFGVRFVRALSACIFALLGIAIFLPAHGVLADEIFSSNVYGTCPYQQNCPTTTATTSSIPPTTTTTTTTSTSTPPGTSVPPGSSTPPGSSQPPGTGNPPGTTQPPGGTTQNNSGNSFLSKEFTSSVSKSDLGKFWQEKPWFLPFLLFILLLVMALILTIQAGIEHRNIIRLRRMYEKLSSLQDEVRTFLQLLQHNLRVPVATMNMALELMIGKNIQKAKLTYELLTTMSQDVETLTNASVAEMERPPDIKARLDAIHTNITETLKSKLFWGPMVAVLILVVAYDVLTYAVFPFSFSTQLALLEMGVMFGGVLVLMNSIGFYRRSRQRRFLMGEIRTEFTELEEHRTSMVNQISTKLQQDYDLVASAIKDLPPSHETLLVQSGAAQMRALLDKLAVIKLVQDPHFFTMTTQATYSLDTELKSIIQKVTAVIPHRDIELDALAVADKPGMGYLVPLEFVLMSVIDNAARHGVAGEPVHVTAATKHDSYVVTITNAAESLTAENVEQLFKPFSRVGNMLQYNQAGAGISLFASRLVMERLGGSILLTVPKPQQLVCTVAFPIRFEPPVPHSEAHT